VAVNLAGVAVEQLHRGQVLAHPGSITPSERLDARISLLRSAPKAIEQDTRLEFFHGAAEHPMWLTLLDRERIEPGEQGWVQLRFRQPVVVARGDRFILRQPSPGITVGGGVIVDSAPERHRRFQTAVITALEARERDDPETLIAQMIANRLVTRLELESGIATSDLDAAIAVLESGGALIRLPATPSDLFTAPGVLRGFENNLLKSLEQFHRENPARKGMPSDDLRRRSGLTSPPGAFDAITRLLETAGQVIDDGATLRRRGFSIEVPEAQRAAATHWLAAIEQSPFSPPSPGDFGIDANTQLALVERGDLIRAAELVFLTPDSLAAVETSVLGLLDERERISLADVRDRFGTSRKYAQALLELLDARRVTRRIGDERVRFATRTPST
jgi:selenocysteine-specific elongation factor